MARLPRSGDRGQNEKLIWAGRAIIEGTLWKTGRAVKELDDDAEFWGIPRALLDNGPADQGLWPEHETAAEAFLRIRGQWRVLPVFGAAPVWLGLDYSAAETGLRLAGYDLTPAFGTELQLIEQGAKAALNGD